MPGREQFEDLIQEFCFMAGIDNVSAILHGGVLRIDDYLVRIDYLEEIERCRVLVDLGEPHWEREADFYRLMLQTNFDNGSAFFPTLSLQPETNRVILSLHILLDTLGNEVSLARLLREHVGNIIEGWKDIVEESLVSHYASLSGIRV